MNATLFNLIITGVVALFVVIGMLWGLGRGLKKTAIRSLWLLVTAILLGLTLSTVITNALINAEWNITIDGTTYTTLQDALTEVLKDPEVAKILGDNVETVANVMVAYSAMIINSIVFVLLFWVCKIVLYPVYWALTKWVFLSKKERQYKADLKVYKAYRKEYERVNKGKPRVEAVGFAAGDDKMQPLEEELKELEEGNSKEEKKAYNSLIRARQAYDSANLKSNQSATTSEDNELLDRPYVETKKEDEKPKEEPKVEEEFVPKDEYKPDVKEELKPVEKPKKLKKHRLLGMLVGAVCGLLVGGVTLSPIIGVLNIAKEANNECVIELEDGKQQGVVDYFTNGMFSDINTYYEGSIGCGILRYTGTEWVSNETFKALTKSKIDGVNVNLTKDLGTIMSIVAEANVLKSNYDDAVANDYPVATMSKIVMSIDKIVDKLFEISIVDKLSPALIDMAATAIESNITDDTTIGEGSTSTSENLDLNKILRQVATGLRSVAENNGSLKLELKSIVNMLMILNHGVVLDGQVKETSLLAQIIKSSNENNTEVIRVIQKLNYEYHKTHNEDFYFTYLVNNAYTYGDYETKVVSSVMPTAVDYTLNIMLREIGMGTVADALQITNNQQIKTFVLNTFTEVFRIMYEFNTTYDSSGLPVYREFSEDTFGTISLKDINRNVFVSFGKIVDGIGGLFDDENYKTLVDGLGDTVADTMGSLFGELMGADDATTLSTNIGLAIKGFEKGSFENEFTAIGDMFNYLLVGNSYKDAEGGTVNVSPLLDNTADFSFDNKDKWKFEIGNIRSIGTLLNSMQNVSIFKYKAEGESKNNLSFLFDAILQKTKADLIAEMQNTTADPSIIDDKTGFITNVSEINQVLYNAINVVQVNLNAGLDADGAFDWADALGGDDLFLGVLDDVIKQNKKIGSDKLLDFVGNNKEGKTILAIILQNSEQVQLTTTASGKVCALDTMKDNSLFKGVAVRLLTDLKAVVPSLLDGVDQDYKDDFNNIISNILTTLSEIEKDSKSNKLITYHKYIETINNAITDLYSDGAIEIDFGNVATMRKLGKFLDTMTTNNNGVTVLRNKVVVEVVQNLVSKEIIKTIDDNRTNYPIKTFLKTVQNNIETAQNGSSWEAIFGAFTKISSVDFASLTDVKSSLDTLGKVLDIISGRAFKIEDTDDKTVSVTLVTDEDIKMLMIGMIANSMIEEDSAPITGIRDAIGANGSQSTELLEIMFSLGNNTVSDLDTIAKLNATIYQSDVNDNYKYFGKYNVTYSDNKISGVLENIYHMNTTTDVVTKDAFTWEQFCARVKNIVDIDVTINLGKFAHTENGKTYTYYAETETGSDGIGVTFDNIITNNSDLISIDQIRYLLDKSIDGKIATSEYVTGALIAKIKGNIAKVEGDFNTEFKSIQYLIDIADYIKNNAETTDTAGKTSFNTEALKNFGQYMDEILTSKVVGNLGNNVVVTMLDKVYADSDVTDKITTVDSSLNTFLGSTSEATNKHFFAKEAVKGRVNDIYAQNATNPNAIVFEAIASLKETINSINIENMTPPENLLEMANFVATANTTLARIAKALNSLQNNPLVGIQEARFATMSIMQQMVDEFDKWCTNEARVAIFTAKGHSGYKYSTDAAGRYSTENANSFVNYMKGRVDNNTDRETYVDAEGNCKTTFETTDYGYDYMLQRLLDDFQARVRATLGL